MADTELSVLRTLVRISHAVLRAEYFDEAVEVIAEQALIALAAASLSISRWDRETNTLRTLINVGDLGPGEQPWPVHETYAVPDYPHVAALLEHHRPFVNAVDDETSEPSARALLRELGKECELGVPVVYDGQTWGEIWATGTDGRRFGPGDVALLRAIAAHTAVAFGRSEQFSTIWNYAHQDPLTGLANRRALDRRLLAIGPDTGELVCLICDVDGFKDVNDNDGHAAGDAVLRTVAGILDSAAAQFPRSFTARLGGDEFCVLLAQATPADAERFARTVGEMLRARDGDRLTISWGAATAEPVTTSGQHLLAAADAALLTAKRLGPGRFNAGTPVPPRLPGTTGTRRLSHDDLVPRVLEILDRLGSFGVLDALEILAVEAHRQAGAAGWSVSITPRDSDELRTVRGVNTVRDHDSGLSVVVPVPGDAYRIADYPATERAIVTGVPFIADVAVGDSDPEEVRLLREFGYRAVLGAGGRHDGRGLLLEIYSGTGHTELDAVAPHVRVLMRYCLTTAHPT